MGHQAYFSLTILKGVLFVKITTQIPIGISTESQEWATVLEFLKNVEKNPELIDEHQEFQMLIHQIHRYTRKRHRQRQSQQQVDQKEKTDQIEPKKNNQINFGCYICKKQKF